MLKPIKAWVIAGPDGVPRFTFNNHTIGVIPELFSSYDRARVQNIDWRNDSKVVQVEIRQVKPKRKK